MADEPTNLIFEYLRWIDSRLDGIERNLGMIVAGISSLDDQFAIIKSDLALIRNDLSRLEHRMDNFDQPLLRIERRLDLIEA